MNGSRVTMGERTGSVRGPLPLYQSDDPRDVLVDVAWDDGGYSWEHASDLTVGVSLTDEEFDARVAECERELERLRTTPRWRFMRRARLQRSWQVMAAALWMAEAYREGPRSLADYLQGVM